MSALVLYLATASFIVWRCAPRAPAARFPPLIVIVLLLLPLLFTGNALLTGRVYGPVDLLYLDPPFDDFRADFGIRRIHNGMTGDPFAQFVPWQRAVRDAYSRREWPLWNRTLLGGAPLAAELQSAPYDPFNLLGLVLPIDLFFGFEASLTLFFAALFAFAFVRALGASEHASLIAAAGYALSSAMAFTLGWAPHTRTWAFLPLVLLLVRRLVRTPDVRNGALLMLALAVMVLFGHPESMLHVVSTGAAYAIFELIPLRRRARAIAIALMAGALALLLTAFSLMPFFDVLPQTVEYATRRYEAQKPVKTDWSLVERRAATALLPWYGGSQQSGRLTSDWDTGNARAGSVILALALAGALVTWRRRETKFFALAALFCLFAAAEAPPVTHLLHRLPLFDIALNDRFAFAAALFLSILAAFGWDSANRRTAIVVSVVCVALAVASALLVNRERRIGVEPALIAQSIAIELGALIAVAFVIARRGDARTAFAVTYALLLLQRTGEDGRIYAAVPREAFYPRIPIIDAIARDTPFRVAGVKNELRPNSAALFGVEDARGYEAMTFEPYAGTFPLWCEAQGVSHNRVDDLGRPFLSFLNVRYAFARIDVPVPAGWRIAKEDRGSRLLENTRVLPRVFAPKRIRYVRDPLAVEREWLDETDFGNRAWIEMPREEPHEGDNAQAAIAFKRIKLGYSVDATLDRDGWIVISDAAWRGWRAYLDHKRVEIHMANRAFIGIFVPKGHHKLRVVYWPEAFVRGRAISLATLLALLAAVSWRRLRSRRATAGMHRPPTPA